MAAQDRTAVASLTHTRTLPALPLRLGHQIPESAAVGAAQQAGRAWQAAPPVLSRLDPFARE